MTAWKPPKHLDFRKVPLGCVQIRCKMIGDFLNLHLTKVRSIGESIAVNLLANH